jgi:small-conductance mechanosensitive channel
MAAVFALVFLFVVASIAGMFKALSGADFGTVAAMLAFGTLASGIFVGLYRLARQWENEVPTGE